MINKPYILVTGGAGYIGSHMAGLLLKAGYPVVVFDDLSTGVKPWIPQGAKLFKGDVCDLNDCEAVFEKYPIRAVMHFAAKIVVPESVKKPDLYYQNNVGGSLNLLKAMAKYKVKRIIFSSTASVYGNPKKVPVTEKSSTVPLNPYGASKLMVEKALQKLAKKAQVEFIALRYFNVAGWDTSRAWPIKGRPVPTHLIANVMKVLRSGQGSMTVCGNDYKTHDGSGVRDFIHVLDLAQAHLLALKAMDKGIKNEIFNLGNGNGFSVLDVIQTTQKVTGRPVPHTIGPRRLGDVATVVASSAKARKLLSWKPKFDLKAILKSEWERKV